MPRGLSAAQQQAAESNESDVIHLLSITFYDDGTQSESKTRLTTAAQDIDADVGNGTVTFSGVGGWLDWGAFTESADKDAQGVTITMSGVEQSIISLLLNNQFRGRPAKLWRAYFDRDSGQILGDPILLFHGRQLGDYEVTENWGDTVQSGTVEISTQVKSVLSELQEENAVRTNPRSYHNALARVGLSIQNSFFNKVRSFAGKRVFWGTEVPDTATQGGDSGGQYHPGPVGGGDGPGGAADPKGPEHMS